MHPLLQPPQHRMSTKIRMPAIQDVSHAVAGNLQASLMDRDAFRLIKTTARNRICSGPLSSPQLFVTSGGVNTPASMRAGSHKMNSPRSVAKTRGQSAGL